MFFNKESSLSLHTKIRPQEAQLLLYSLEDLRFKWSQTMAQRHGDFMDNITYKKFTIIIPENLRN